MQIGLCGFREVEVNHNIHRLNIDSSGEKVRTNEMSCGAIAELMKYSISVGLFHFRMNIKAAESKLSHFFREQLHTVH